MKAYNMEETALAREELKKQLLNVTTLVAESVASTAKAALTDSIDLVDSRLRSSLAHLDPRPFIRERPLVSIAGAFLTGLVLTSQRGLKRELSHSGSKLPILSAATSVGADILRAYGLSVINRSSRTAQ